jgi:uncharacterized protein (PEP-CTERM system associated)
VRSNYIKRCRGTLTIFVLGFSGALGSANAQEGAPDFVPEMRGSAAEPAGPAPASTYDDRSAAPGAYNDFSYAYGAASAPGAPAWSVIPRIGIRETFTDNARLSSTDSESDLLSQISAGVSITGRTPSLDVNFDYAALLRRNIVATEQDGLSHYGFATAHAIVIPDRFFLDVRGSASEFQRDGTTPLDPSLRNRSNTTQNFSITASPNLTWRFGTSGYGVAQYSFGHSWYVRNTGNIITPDGAIGPIDDATQHQGNVSLVFPGTFAPQLLSTVSARASSFEGGRLNGRLERASAQLNSEYQFNRFFSIIGAGGYETLSHPFSPVLDGEGEIWDVGARWRLNPDSYVVATYGRHDLSNRWSAEMRYGLTPLTSVNVIYSDSLTTSQQSGFGGLSGSSIGAGGPSGRLLNPTIASLNSGYSQLGGEDGVPLSDVNGVGGYSSGYFNVKSVQGAIHSQAGESNIGLTIYHLDRQPLYALGASAISSTGARLSWGRPLNQNLGVFAAAGYQFQDFNDTKFFDGRLGMNYRFGLSLLLNVQYSYLYRDTDFGSGGYSRNALTIALTKRFE